MKTKDSYDMLIDEIRGKTSASNRASGKASSAVSKSDMENCVLGLMNSPDHTFTQYSFSSKDTSGTGEPVGVDKKPSARYRAALKPMLRKLGMDKHDVDAVETIPFDKEHAAAAAELITYAVHDYMLAGRKFAFPVTEPDECRLEIACQKAPERVSVGNRFKKDGDNDSVTVTKERTVIKAKNAVPYWLKESK